MVKIMENFISRDGRQLETGKRVAVYRNLHNGLYSVKCLKSDHVLGYVKNIVLDNVTFTVRKKGLERVRQEKRKNVHAFIIGFISSDQTSFKGENEV